eukprot:510844-Rhodomonas_salina.1
MLLVPGQRRPARTVLAEPMAGVWGSYKTRARKSHGIAQRDVTKPSEHVGQDKALANGQTETRDLSTCDLSTKGGHADAMALRQAVTRGVASLPRQPSLTPPFPRQPSLSPSPSQVGAQLVFAGLEKRARERRESIGGGAERGGGGGERGGGERMLPRDVMEAAELQSTPRSALNGGFINGGFSNNGSFSNGSFNNGGFSSG